MGYQIACTRNFWIKAVLLLGCYSWKPWFGVPLEGMPTKNAKYTNNSYNSSRAVNPKASVAKNQTRNLLSLEQREVGWIKLRNIWTTDMDYMWKAAGCRKLCRQVWRKHQGDLVDRADPESCRRRENRKGPNRKQISTHHVDSFLLSTCVMTEWQGTTGRKSRDEEHKASVARDFRTRRWTPARTARSCAETCNHRKATLSQIINSSPEYLYNYKDSDWMFQQAKSCVLCVIPAEFFLEKNTKKTQQVCCFVADFAPSTKERMNLHRSDVIPSA